ncbi:hypothetical protein D3C87_2013260 [compost metagenome]
MCYQEKCAEHGDGDSNQVERSQRLLEFNRQVNGDHNRTGELQYGSGSRIGVFDGREISVLDRQHSENTEG